MYVRCVNSHPLCLVFVNMQDAYYMTLPNRRLRTKSKKRLLSLSRPSVCLHTSAWLPRNSFLWTLILETCMGICLKSDNNVGHFIRRPKYVYIVDKSADGTHFCLSMSTLSGCILLTATCRSTTIQKKSIFAFPWQQWIGERAQQSCVLRTWPILFSKWLNQNYPKIKDTL